MLTRGAIWATSSQRVLARLWHLIFAAFDGPCGHDQPDLVRMPAHCPASSVGVARLSNGQFLREVDRMGNMQADLLAKKGAELHRVPVAVRQKIRDREDAVRFFAARLGIVTHAANHHTAHDSACGVSVPRRDSDGLPAARARARRRLQCGGSAEDEGDVAAIVPCVAPALPIERDSRARDTLLAQHAASLLAAAREHVGGNNDGAAALPPALPSQSLRVGDAGQAVARCRSEPATLRWQPRIRMRGREEPCQLQVDAAIRRLIAHERHQKR